MLRRRGLEAVAIQDREKWLRKYNRTQRINYVPLEGVMSNPLILIPEGQVDNYERQEARYQYDKYISEGDRLLNRSQFDAARNKYRDALSVGYDNARAKDRLRSVDSKEFNYYMDRGDRYMRRNQFSLARSEYRKAQALGYDLRLVEERLEDLKITEESYVDPATQGLNHIIDFKAVAPFENKLFASFVLGMTGFSGERVGQEYGDFFSGVGLLIQSDKDTEIEYEIIPSEDQLLGPVGRRSLQIQKGTNLYFPSLPWKYKALRELDQQSTIGLTLRLHDDSGQTKEKVETIDVMDPNYCLLYFYGDDFRRDFKYLLAAYVNEDHPEIGNITREALEKGYVSNFLGYQGGEQAVREQVAAVFRVLHDRGMVYSSFIDEVRRDRIFYQYIRRFSEAIGTTQANCIDGTVVMASILMRIGLRPVIITVPGHAFLGYYLDPEGEKMVFLETTMVGQSLGNPNKPEEEMTQEELDFEFYRLFEKATIQGKLKYYEDIARYGDAVQQYDITQLRKIINPIGD